MVMLDKCSIWSYNKLYKTWHDTCVYAQTRYSSVSCLLFWVRRDLIDGTGEVKELFHEGEFVMYSGEGLCRIEKIGIPEFQAEKNGNYYFLRKTDDNSRIYVPINTTLPMRKPLTAAEANRFLSGLPVLSVDVPRKIDSKKRMPIIRETVHEQTAEAMAKTIRMIRSLHPDGKIPSDEKTILARTEKRLCEEISFALHISSEDAEIRIKNALRSVSVNE